MNTSLNGTNGDLFAATSKQMITPSEALRQRGLVSAQGIIPIKLNERIKSMARKQGVTASQLVGELIQQASHVVDQFDASEQAALMREKFGPNWQQILSDAASADGEE